MKKLDIEKMEMIQGGSCGGAIAGAVVFGLVGTVVLVGAAVTTGVGAFALLGFFASRAAAAYTVINGCTEWI